MVDTSILELTPAEVNGIFSEVRKQSVVQRLARQVPLAPGGTKTVVWTGKPVAGFVGEGDEKPVSDPTATTKTMTPEKLAVIVPVSAELVRASQGNGLLEDLQAQMVEAIAVAFDQAVLYGTDSPFAASLADTSYEVELDADGVGVYKSLNGVLRTLSVAGKKLTGWALDTVVEADLNEAGPNGVSSIFVDSAAEPNTVFRSGRLLGRPAFLGEGLGAEDGSVLGFGGDFSQIVWGQVSSINIDVTDQATITLNDNSTLNLWQRNMLALRAEVEYGVLINDVNAFVKITPDVADS